MKIKYTQLHTLIEKLQYVERTAKEYAEICQMYYRGAPFDDNYLRFTLIDDSLIIHNEYRNETFGYKILDKKNHPWDDELDYISPRDADGILNGRVYKIKQLEDNPSGIYTYLIFDERTGLYKIGKSKDPYKRMKILSNLQSSFRPSLRLVSTINADVESFLHCRFKSKRHHGEWFGLDEKDVKFIKRGYFNGKYYHPI